MTFKHDNAKSVWTTVRIEGESDLKTVMNIETDLVINPDHPDHNAGAMNDLVNSAKEYYEANDYLDRIDVSQIAER